MNLICITRLKRKKGLSSLPAFSFLCLYYQISKYIPLSVRCPPIISLTLTHTYTHSYTHTHSSLGELSATFSVGLMWQKNGAKDLTPRSGRTSACRTARRRTGWLAFGSTSRLAPLLYSYVWEFGIQTLSQVTDINCTLNAPQETAVVAVVLLSPPGVFAALVLTNLLGNSSGHPEGGENKQRRLFSNICSCAR